MSVYSLFHDHPSDREPPVHWVRCLLCGETLPEDWIGLHSDECDISRWESV